MSVSGLRGLNLDGEVISFGVLLLSITGSESLMESESVSVSESWTLLGSPSLVDESINVGGPEEAEEPSDSSEVPEESDFWGSGVLLSSRSVAE